MTLLLRAILSTLLSVVVIVLAISVAATVIGALLLGLAWLLSLVFPIGIMGAAGVLMFVSGAFVFYIAMSSLTEAVRARPLPLDEYWEDEDWEDEEEDLPPPPPPVWRKPPIKLPTMPPGRQVKPDDLCPCGSGRKYKNCCGKKK